ncbi:hypothetical protein SYNPS1DRAFT_28029 [Syncephalis pseudoplumigaleata]|uniref:Pentacotripeptide-repeat region of PRORP domain-containing protein n=1 Tax=Syncephalis pseudoplumigaleata TaxID=1712513 RepID=A0A4P9Z1P9_9FUNG|nr:hypothetical protein SYNPS1DRAFT_28029 [Syncephalis pseudoplumigaleata]|eukprot:RKP26275.1 hypothetical protein SYNPS1DRAFT_28029 [Syncephalis pseudoplumigaleata]
MSYLLLRRLAALAARSGATRDRAARAQISSQPLRLYRAFLPRVRNGNGHISSVSVPLDLLARSYTASSRTTTPALEAEEHEEQAEAYPDGHNDSSAAILSQHLTEANRQQLQAIEAGGLALRQMRDIPIKVHNVHLANLKISGQLAPLLKYYQRMKMVQLPEPKYMARVSPELAQQATHHPVYPLCNQHTYSVVMQAVAELHDRTAPIVGLLTEIYWDLSRAGWPPSRTMTRTMLHMLAEREIAVQRRLDALERPRLIAKLAVEGSGASMESAVQPEEWHELMAECNLEQAMVIFLSTPPEVRMSLHRTLLNLLLKAAAERGDPHAALAIFEWMNVDGHKLPTPAAQPSLAVPLPPAKATLLGELNAATADAPLSRIASSVQWTNRPSAMAHPSSIIRDLAESQLDPIERRRITTTQRMHHRLQTPTHSSYAELAGAFARSGDLVSALVCIRTCTEHRHLLRVRQPDLVHQRIAEMLARRGDLGAAVWMVISRMRTDGVSPSSSCLRVVTRAICDWGRVDYAAQFLRRVRREADVGAAGVLDGNHTLPRVVVSDADDGTVANGPARLSKDDEANITLFAASYNEILEAACRSGRTDPLQAQLAHRVFGRRRQRTSTFTSATLNAYLQLVADLGDSVAVCEALAEMRAAPHVQLEQASITALLALLHRGSSGASEAVRVPTPDEKFVLMKRLLPGERWMEPRKAPPPATRFKTMVQRVIHVLLPSSVVGNSRQRRSWRQDVAQDADAASATPQSSPSHSTVAAQHLDWIRQIAQAAIRGAGLVYGAPRYRDLPPTHASPVERLLCTLDQWHSVNLQAVIARAIMRECRRYQAVGVTMGLPLSFLVLHTQVRDCELFADAQRQLSALIHDDAIDTACIESIRNDSVADKLRPGMSSADHLNQFDLHDMFSLTAGIFSQHPTDADYSRGNDENEARRPLWTERVDLYERLLACLSGQLRRAYLRTVQPGDIQLALEMQRQTSMLAAAPSHDKHASTDASPPLATWRTCQEHDIQNALAKVRSASLMLH